MGAFYIAVSSTIEFQRILHVFNEKGQINLKQSNELKVLLAEYIDAFGIVKQLSTFTSRLFA